MIYYQKDGTLSSNILLYSSHSYWSLWVSWDHLA